MLILWIGIIWGIACSVFAMVWVFAASLRQEADEASWAFPEISGDSFSHFSG
jgi:hypothetical protein